MNPAPLFSNKYFKTGGVIGRWKTPWTGDTTNRSHKDKRNKKTEPMKINNKLTLAALAATLLFHTSITRAGDHGKAVPPSNPFVILLEGTFQPAGVVRDLGLVLPHLNNGVYQKVPIYRIDSGVPGPTDEVVGTFYAVGGEMLFAYDLRKGVLTAMMIPGTSVVERINDAVGNGFTLQGTYELDILEATGIYRSFAGGHIHMVDVLHITPGTPIVRVEHCFCYISKIENDDDEGDDDNDE